jgi:hypothetical protein
MINELTPQELRAAHLLALLGRNLSWRAFEETANEYLTLSQEISKCSASQKTEREVIIIR